MSLTDSIANFNSKNLKKTKTRVTTLSDYNLDEEEKEEIPTISTSHKSKEEIQEFYDEKDTLKKHAKDTAKLIKNSKHFVVYTGAGISTSTGIPDFRGPNGVWTKLDEGKRPEGSKMLDEVKPSYAHYALIELHKKGYLKHVVTTNCDNLHRRSGFTDDNISELHGNAYREVCIKCNITYIRDFDVVLDVDYSFDPKITIGRKCDKCKGFLRHSVVAFGEFLPKEELQKAHDESLKCDLALVIGTSMRVKPSSDMPSYNCGKGEKGNLIICNLQKTPFDDISNVRVFAKSDDFIKLVMEELGLKDFDQSYDMLDKKKE